MKKQLLLMLSLVAMLAFSPTQAYSGSDTRECIIDASHAVIGITEVAPNSGVVIDQMLATVQFDPGAAWCGAAVAYNYSQCIPTAALDSYLSMQKWAYTPYTYSKAKAANAIIYQSGKYTLSKHKRPLPADVFWIYSSTKGRVVHTGIIDTWHPYGRMAITLEGNTNYAGSSDGDGFYVMYRDKRQIYAVADVLNQIV